MPRRPSRDCPVRPTRSVGRSTTCGSPSPIGATSDAPTACPRRSSARTTSSCRATRSCRSRRSSERPGSSSALGVEKLRITGGEPLVRRDLPDLIAMLAAIRRPDGGELDLTLTTNGSALRALARPLADAGLRRITVSLDSLDDAVFGAMNGIDFPVERVLDGIDAAFEAGLTPVKVNMVVRRGINETSVIPMARWARETGRDPALHRVHGRRPLERLAARRGRPGRRADRHDRRRLAGRARGARLPRRGRRPLARTPTAAASSG